MLVLHFNKYGGVFIYDLSGTFGTFINKNQVKKNMYMELHVGDVLRFGQKKELLSVKNLTIQSEKRNMEDSLLQAKREAPLVDGISWGMDDDGVEENEFFFGIKTDV
uniref:FHA domain-containing protein n=1 Tax=Lactuca sativa TaxID=4236 RepID=A0A9R1UZS2_LACSA|nr:hypothetical protein LSAT_V11C700376970 [Lactuca sativa]